MMTAQKSTVPPPEMTLVVGIQNDDTGMHTWNSAAALAHNGERILVHLCHCVGEADGDVENKLSVGEHLLAQWAAKRLFVDNLNCPTEIHVAVGDVATVLRQLAVDVQADMIVVGTHRKGALRRVVDGSVVHDLLEDSPCSVVVAVPTDYTGRESSPKIEDPLPANAASRNLGAPHHYSYRRAVRVNFPNSSFGLERTP